MNRQLEQQATGEQATGEQTNGEQATVEQATSATGNRFALETIEGVVIQSK